MSKVPVFFVFFAFSAVDRPDLEPARRAVAALPEPLRLRRDRDEERRGLGHLGNEVEGLDLHVWLRILPSALEELDRQAGAVLASPRGGWR